MSSATLDPAWILTPPVESAFFDLLGGKARALAALAEAGFPVPSFLVVTPEAFSASLGEKGLAALRDSRSPEEAGRLLDAMTICPEVRDALIAAVETLCNDGQLVAVRSSALDEDGADHSFAGQLESHLYVAPEQVPDKVLAVWKSAFAPRVWAYRRERNLGQIPQAPAVLIQRMIAADAAGVAFSADPVSRKREFAVVASVCGLGTALVSGDTDADTFHVDESGQIIMRDIRRKSAALRFDPKSSERVSPMGFSDSQALEPAVDDRMVQAVARLARSCERHFGAPQDIEWAIEGDQLWLVQSRPITTLNRQQDAEGIVRVWDNSNIVESYGGVTTPLTFSFVRRVYEEVYRQFCRLMRVPESRVEAADEVFSGMLGLIRGRIYYNLVNWHRVLAMLPGYEVNRRFMEQMMGVREPLPPEAQPAHRPTTLRGKCRDLLHLAGTVVGLVENHFTLPRQIIRFQSRLESALASPVLALEIMQPDQLAAYYRDLEQQLLKWWDAPLVNDFFAMIFHGVLRRLCERWCQSPDGALANELISDEGGIISAEPAQRMKQLALLAAPDPTLVGLLQNGAPGPIRTRLCKHPQMQAQIEEYLEKFGDRCLDELKLESATLQDDPALLYRSIGNLAAVGNGSQPRVSPQTTASAREIAEEKARTALGHSKWRAAVFDWVLRHARERVRNRENLRFDRTRLFGRVRRIFVELGRRFHAMGVLDDARDVFYLELNEVLGVIDGTATTTDMAGLVRVRKAEFQRYRETPAPADRLITRGAVGNASEEMLRGTPRECVMEAGTTSAEERKGLGCCPGVVRGHVRVVTDPRNAVVEPGEILVAERTDPGWVMLFPAAAGLLVERGSLLSHSAIVSRELGLPGIVSISHLTSWLRTGDEVVMDGSTGVVRRIAPAQP